jgi:hypothetical protein
MEREKDLNLEAIRQEVELKISRILEKVPSHDDKKYGALNLNASAFHEWIDRPVIDETKEPLELKGDVRVILIESEEEKAIQLHVAPEEEQPRVRHVYILNLFKDESPELMTYNNRPVESSLGEVPASMLPFDVETREASVEILIAFNKFLEQGKLVSAEK